MFLIVTLAASVRALVARVRMKVSISGHHASMVFLSRVVSGIAANATYWLNRRWAALASARVVQARTSRSCSLAPGRADLAGRVVGGEDVVESSSAAFGEGVGSSRRVRVRRTARSHRQPS